MIIHVKNKNTLIIDDFELKCCVGKNGLKYSKIEGDYSTPKGLFDLKKIYFREDRVGIPKCSLKKKIINVGGSELASDLWQAWGLKGTFNESLSSQLDQLYNDIKIDNAIARIRAFKSLNWAPNWTSINSSIFNKLGNLIIPYYENEMCKFICTVPEEFLHGRKIQIEYIKNIAPKPQKYLGKNTIH